MKIVSPVRRIILEITVANSKVDWSPLLNAWKDIYTVAFSHLFLHRVSNIRLKLQDLFIIYCQIQLSHGVYNIFASSLFVKKESQSNWKWSFLCFVETIVLYKTCHFVFCCLLYDLGNIFCWYVNFSTSCLIFDLMFSQKILHFTVFNNSGTLWSSNNPVYLFRCWVTERSIILDKFQCLFQWFWFWFSNSALYTLLLTEVAIFVVSLAPGLFGLLICTVLNLDKKHENHL